MSTNANFYYRYYLVNTDTGLKENEFVTLESAINKLRYLESIGNTHYKITQTWKRMV